MLSDMNLVWSPVGVQLLDRISHEGGIRLLMAPFIQRSALSILLEHLSSSDDIKIITRWKAEDLATGVSDPYVYEECATHNIPLYIHPTIHLKLFTMGSGNCFCGSANITMSGLGLPSDGNLEAGVWSSVGVGDWLKVYEIIESSRLVDEAVFKVAAEYSEKFLKTGQQLPPLCFPRHIPHEYTLASLPATSSPETVAAFGVGECNAENENDINCLMHDLVQFGVKDHSDKKDILVQIGEQFLAHPFVKKAIEHIKESGSLRFGEMADWIHAHCDDVPIPYRWEVKSATHVLFNWLEYYVPAISWSVPGKYSQVIKYE